MEGRALRGGVLAFLVTAPFLSPMNKQVWFVCPCAIFWFGNNSLGGGRNTSNAGNVHLTIRGRTMLLLLLLLLSLSLSIKIQNQITTFDGNSSSGFRGYWDFVLFQRLSRESFSLFPGMMHSSWFSSKLAVVDLLKHTLQERAKDCSVRNWGFVLSVKSGNLSLHPRKKCGLLGRAETEPGQIATFNFWLYYCLWWDFMCAPTSYF